MKRYLIVSAGTLLALLLAIGCAQKPPEDQLFQEATKLQADAAQLKSGDSTNTQAIEKFQEAVGKYEKLVKLYPEGKNAANSQFMVGWIYANEIKDLEKAKAAYEAFLEKYSTVADSGIVVGAKVELEFLGKPVDSLLKNIPKESQTALSDTAKGEGTNP